MSKNSHESLVDRFFQDDLDATEQVALAELLSQSPAMRERFQSQIRTEGQLLALTARRKLEIAIVGESEPEGRNTTRADRHTHWHRWKAPGLLRRNAMVIATLAATILFLVNFFRMPSSSASAAELFMQIERASLQLVDRVYGLERIVRRDDKFQRVTGKLSCRGSRAFVAEFPKEVIGGDAQGLWCVLGSTKALKFPTLDEIEDEHVRLELGWLLRLRAEPPDQSVFSAARVLSLVRIYDYEIRALPDEQDATGVKLNALECQLANSSDLPRTVRIWSDETSKEIQRLELDWGAGERRRAADLLTFELISTEKLDDDRFRMETYLSR